jgi:hypothetical protein
MSGTNFNKHYSELDSETQIQLDHFLAGIEEVGQHIVGRTIFRGSGELLNKFMPCLQTISSSIRISESNLNGDSNLYELTWMPNDLDIPGELLLRAIDRALER